MTIKYRKKTKFGIQEEQILFLLDIKFSQLPVQIDQIVNLSIWLKLLSYKPDFASHNIMSIMHAYM